MFHNSTVKAPIQYVTILMHRETQVLFLHIVCMQLVCFGHCLHVCNNMVVID